jgi:FemAB family protein
MDGYLSMDIPQERRQTGITIKLEHERMTIQLRPVVETNSIGAVVLKALTDAGVGARLRSADAAAWWEASRRMSYLPVAYSSALIDYQLAYWSGNGLPTQDISVLLVHDNRPCGIWPLSVTFDAEEKWRIGSSGGPVVPPLFVSGLARKSVKSVTAGCLAALDSMCIEAGQTYMDSVETYVGIDGLSEWHDRLMQIGARADLRHDLFLDLAPPMAEIKSTFRRSYKSLIAAGNKLWKVHVLTAADLEPWEEFRLLHLAVAERATRSDESWRLQHDAISTGDAFLVFLRDQAGRMVGGGFFHTTTHEGFYAVGAYDRSLFKNPLGHVVQYHAIEEMKRRGIRWYKLGARIYSASEPTPSDKEITISNFKQGFASHLFPCYCLRYGSSQR